MQKESNPGDYQASIIYRTAMHSVGFSGVAGRGRKDAAPSLALHH